MGKRRSCGLRARRRGRRREVVVNVVEAGSPLGGRNAARGELEGVSNDVDERNASATLSRTHRRPDGVLERAGRRRETRGTYGVEEMRARSSGDRRRAQGRSERRALWGKRMAADEREGRRAGGDDDERLSATVGSGRDGEGRSAMAGSRWWAEGEGGANLRDGRPPSRPLYRWERSRAAN